MRKHIVICCVFMVIISSITTSVSLYVQRYTTEKNMLSISKIYEIEVDFKYEINEYYLKSETQGVNVRAFKLSFDKQYLEPFIQSIQESRYNYSETGAISDEVISELPFFQNEISNSQMYFFSFVPVQSYKFYPRFLIVNGHKTSYVCLRENEQIVEVILLQY